jgi:hypothetical protein
MGCTWVKVKVWSTFVTCWKLKTLKTSRVKAQGVVVGQLPVETQVPSRLWTQAAGPRYRAGG